MPPVHRLYLETSVFGFHFDERAVNLEKRDATRLLFSQVRLGIHRGYTSAAALLEIERTSDRGLRDAIYRLIRDSHIELLELPPDDQKQVSQLADAYVDAGAIPAAKLDDAIHIATMVVRPELEVLVTWNCRHIANINVERRVRSITLAQGYEFNFRILTPEQVVVYEA